MDSVHDLGGRQGFGRVQVETGEPVFHERWEAQARALTVAVIIAARVNGGEFRHSIERMDPVHYLTSSYYEHWLTSALTLGVEHRLFSVDELEARAGGPVPLSRPARVPRLANVAPGSSEPRFDAGDAVTVIDRRPAGHTRCPWYVRGRPGVIERFDGVYSVPDVEAHSDERREEPTYSVRFDASDLWDDAEPGAVVHVDLWESYLEAAR
jgi:nitrile hydratase